VSGIDGSSEVRGKITEKSVRFPVGNTCRDVAVWAVKSRVSLLFYAEVQTEYNKESKYFIKPKKTSYNLDTRKFPN
jgi:hypothetical protein